MHGRRRLLLLQYIEIFQASASVEKHNIVVLRKERGFAARRFTQFSISSQARCPFRRREDPFVTAPLPGCISDLLVANRDCRSPASFQNVENEIVAVRLWH